MKTSSKKSFKALPKSYESLCGFYLPRPIHDEVGLKNTLEVADIFAGFEDQMTEGQNDYFDLLCDLIEKYEQDQVNPHALHSTELLQFLAKENQLTGTAIGEILGKTEQMGRLVLRGERKITAEGAKKLAHYFGVRVEAFL